MRECASKPFAYGMPGKEIPDPSSQEKTLSVVPVSCVLY